MHTCQPISNEYFPYLSSESRNLLHRSFNSLSKWIRCIWSVCRVGCREYENTRCPNADTLLTSGLLRYGFYFFLFYTKSTAHSLWWNVYVSDCGLFTEEISAKGKGNLFAVIYELPFESISPVSIFPVRATLDLSKKIAVRRTWSLLGVQMGSFVCQTLVDPFSRPHPALQQRGTGRKSRGEKKKKRDTSLSFRNQIVWWHRRKGCEQEECILFSGSQITSPWAPRRKGVREIARAWSAWHSRSMSGWCVDITDQRHCNRMSIDNGAASLVVCQQTLNQKIKKIK